MKIQLSLAGTQGPSGPQGPEGPQGPPGPQGPSGPAGVSYTHTQGNASAQWTIAHNLGYRPVVQVFTDGGLEVECEILHLSDNVVRISVQSPFTGTARLI